LRRCNDATVRDILCYGMRLAPPPRRHPDGSRALQHVERSCGSLRADGYSARDPSLRLKGGFVRDDAGFGDCVRRCNNATVRISCVMGCGSLHPRGVIPRARVLSSGPRDLARVTSKPGNSTRDPSLRLKSGFVRDDVGFVECVRRLNPSLKQHYCRQSRQIEYRGRSWLLGEFSTGRGCSHNLAPDFKNSNTRFSEQV
jgi:hypothetical protein